MSRTVGNKRRYSPSNSPSELSATKRKTMSGAGPLALSYMTSTALPILTPARINVMLPPMSTPTPLRSSSQTAKRFLDSIERLSTPLIETKRLRPLYQSPSPIISTVLSSAKSTSRVRRVYSALHSMPIRKTPHKQAANIPIPSSSVADVALDRPVVSTTISPSTSKTADSSSWHKESNEEVKQVEPETTTVVTESASKSSISSFQFGSGTTSIAVQQPSPLNFTCNTAAMMDGPSKSPSLPSSSSALPVTSSFPSIAATSFMATASTVAPSVSTGTTQLANTQQEPVSFNPPVSKPANVFSIAGFTSFGAQKSVVEEKTGDCPVCGMGWEDVNHDECENDTEETENNQVAEKPKSSLVSFQFGSTAAPIISPNVAPSATSTAPKPVFSFGAFSTTPSTTTNTVASAISTTSTSNASSISTSTSIDSTSKASAFQFSFPIPATTTSTVNKTPEKSTLTALTPVVKKPDVEEKTGDCPVCGMAWEDVNHDECENDDTEGDNAKVTDKPVSSFPSFQFGKPAPSIPFDNPFSTAASTATASTSKPVFSFGTFSTTPMATLSSSTATSTPTAPSSFGLFSTAPSSASTGSTSASIASSSASLTTPFSSASFSSPVESVQKPSSFPFSFSPSSAPSTGSITSASASQPPLFQFGATSSAATSVTASNPFSTPSSGTSAFSSSVPSFNFSTSASGITTPTKTTHFSPMSPENSMASSPALAPSSIQSQFAFGSNTPSTQLNTSNPFSFSSSASTTTTTSTNPFSFSTGPSATVSSSTPFGSTSTMSSATANSPFNSNSNPFSIPTTTPVSTPFMFGSNSTSALGNTAPANNPFSIPTTLASPSLVSPPMFGGFANSGTPAANPFGASQPATNPFQFSQSSPATPFPSGPSFSNQLSSNPFTIPTNTATNGSNPFGTPTNTFAFGSSSSTGQGLFNVGTVQSQPNVNTPFGTGAPGERVIIKANRRRK